MRIILFVITLLIGACTSTPKSELQVLKEKGVKRYIVWNKKEFTKPAGVQTLSLGAINALGYMGAKNVRSLDRVNGFTYEVSSSGASKDLMRPMTALGPDWEIQEEVEYHTMQSTCQKVTPITCPVTPGPTPDPTPTPTPTPQPIEVAKSWGITRVHANEAKAIVDTSKVRVCVVDTGIDLNHSNRGNILGSIGYAGAVQDGNGHGTHTAGTVAGIGGVGVSRAGLLICKGLSDQGSGSSSGLAQCLTWCGSQGAQIVSNSWGSTQSDALINQAISSLTQRGIYVFVANGNDSGPVNWPARLAGSNPLVYAVAASDQNDSISNFSSRGPETRVISPGSRITSNWPGGSTRVLDGTSMATPHAAGICAYGVARGLKPCIRFSGQVGGYQFGDALTTAK